MEISIHQLRNNVNIIKVVSSWGANYVLYGNNILVVHVAKQLDFSQCPLGIDMVVECIANLLDGNFLAVLRVNSRATNRKNKITTTI
jgi:hypothetical protein